MINILLVEKDINICQRILTDISQKNSNIRFCGLVSSSQDMYNFVKQNNNIIDLIIVNSMFITSNLKDNNLITYNPQLFSNNHNFENTISKNNLIKFLIKEINTKITLFEKTEKYKSRIKKIIIEELLYLGYNFLYDGSIYLFETIYILYTIKKYSDIDLEKEIYPIIAKKYGKTSHNIKCNIRNATEAMYFDCKEEKLIKYLGININKNPGTKKVILGVLRNIDRKTRVSRDTLEKVENA